MLFSDDAGVAGEPAPRRCHALDALAGRPSAALLETGHPTQPAGATLPAAHVVQEFLPIDGADG